MKVGQRQPRADKRFLVEAFWESLNIRFLLIGLLQSWVHALNISGFGKGVASTDQIQMWGNYGSAMLQGCVRDAQLAFDIAQESESRKRMTTTAVLVMRADLEQFRFSTVYMSKEMGTFKNVRLDLVEKAAAKHHLAKDYRDATIEGHSNGLPGDMNHGWLESHFTEKADVILEEWSTLERSLRGDTFYDAVSLDEKAAIIRAFAGQLSMCLFVVRFKLPMSLIPL